MSKLENIKPGEKVVRSSGYTYEQYKVVEVARVTATQIILSTGEKFRKDGTCITSDKRSQVRLHLYTEELAAKIQEQKDLAYLDNVVWERVSSEVRHTIVEMLKASKQ